MRTRSPDFLLNEASRVLSEVRPHVWDGHTLPVPIEEIADSHFGLLVRDVSGIAEKLGIEVHDRERISGALVPEKAEIWIDAGESLQWPRRRRYTIAHELGHWVLHRGPDSVFCRTAAIEPAVTATSMAGATPESWGWDEMPERPGIEWEANVFGGALLLPPNLVRRVWNELGDVAQLAEAFDCSLSAVSGRWQHHYRFFDSPPEPPELPQG